LLQEFFIFTAIHLLIYSVGILICITGILIMLVPREKIKNITKQSEIEAKLQADPLLLNVTNEC